MPRTIVSVKTKAGADEGTELPRNRSRGPPRRLTPRLCSPPDIHTHAHACTRMHKRTSTHTCTHMRTCTHTYTRAHTHRRGQARQGHRLPAPGQTAALPAVPRSFRPVREQQAKVRRPAGRLGALAGKAGPGFNEHQLPVSTWRTPGSLPETEAGTRPSREVKPAGPGREDMPLSLPAHARGPGGSCPSNSPPHVSRVAHIPASPPQAHVLPSPAKLKAQPPPGTRSRPRASENARAPPFPTQTPAL